MFTQGKTLPGNHSETDLQRVIREYIGDWSKRCAIGGSIQPTNITIFYSGLTESDVASIGKNLPIATGKKLPNIFELPTTNVEFQSFKFPAKTQDKLKTLFV